MAPNDSVTDLTTLNMLYDGLAELILEIKLLVQQLKFNNRADDFLAAIVVTNSIPQDGNKEACDTDFHVMDVSGNFLFHMGDVILNIHKSGVL